MIFAISSLVLVMTLTEKPKSARIHSSTFFDNVNGRKSLGFEYYVPALYVSLNT